MECYVCYEPCNDPAPCKCKTVFVHPSCITMMKLYDQKECGMCKTPYVELEEPTRWKTVPLACLFVPTIFRPCYDSNDIDKIVDIFRFVVLFSIVITISNYITYNELDPAPCIICILGFTCFCNTVEQILRKPPHNLNPSQNRDILEA